MPFKSEKQRRYMWRNLPETARRWANEEKSNNRYRGKGKKKGHSKQKEKKMNYTTHRVSGPQKGWSTARMKAATPHHKVIGKPTPPAVQGKFIEKPAPKNYTGWRRNQPSNDEGPRGAADRVRGIAGRYILGPAKVTKKPASSTSNYRTLARKALNQRGTRGTYGSS